MPRKDHVPRVESDDAAADPIYRCALRYGHLAPGNEGVRDFAHSIYMRVLNTLRSCETASPAELGIDRIQSYCYRVAINLRTDLLRSKRLHTAPLISDVAVDSDPSDRLDYADLIARISRALRRLSPEDQELVRLTMIEGHKIADVVRLYASRGIDVHYDKLASRLKRARRRLRDTCHHDASR